MLTKIYNIPIKQPTAGFLIIALLIYNNFSNVNIYGYESHKNSIYTYYYKDNKTDNDIIKWSSCHNYSNETDVLIKLHNEKKINIYGYK